MDKKIVISIGILGGFLLFILFLLNTGADKKSGLVLDQSSNRESPKIPTFLGENRDEGRGSPFFKGTFVREVILEPFRGLIPPLFSERKSEKPDPFRPKKTLTREQIFATVWPHSYVEYLRVFEDMMKKEGFLSAEAAFSFDSDEEILEFLSQVTLYLWQKGVISEEEKGSFQKGISQELRALIKGETQALEEQFLETKEGNLRVALARFTEKLAYAFLLSSPAEAQFGLGVCLFNPFGGDVTPGQGVPDFLGDCYKDNDPSFLVCGPNLWAPCCDCCIPTPDGCFPIGCLNAVCAFWPNAIWDPETGICGCG